MPHYSYLYRDSYFYGEQIIKMIDEVEREREALRGEKLLITSFAVDLKNKVLGISRPLRETKDLPYKIKGTWRNKDGTVMVADDTGRV